MTYIRPFTMTCGVSLLGLGICGFIPSLLETPVPGAGDRVLHILDGNLFGWYHLNVILSGLYVLVGVLGLLMTYRLTDGQLYAKFVTVIFAVLALMGAFAPTSTLFGLAPLHGGDVALHTFIALIAFTFAFLMPATIQTTERGEWPPQQGISQN
jgi:hypothetical protein